MKHYRCNAGKIRTYISLKRVATWSWQQEIFLPKTRTSFREKRVRGCAYLKYLARKWEQRADAAFRRVVELRDPQEAICHVFGVYCSEALNVTWCESRHDRYAKNGQYLGLFQMGSWERSKYGHGDTAIEQAIAAYAYFVDSGRDWSPWACQPH